MTNSDNNKELQLQISRRLMSAAEYQSASFYIPYRYEVPTHRGSLHYFGCRHFQTPENHQFPKISSAIKEIRPSIVLVEHLQELHRSSSVNDREAFIASIAELSPEDAASLGESQLTANLALKLGTELDCPEPTDRERFTFLSRAGYTAEQIASYYITRAASMYELWKHKMSLESLIEFRARQLYRSWLWDTNLLSTSVVDNFLQRSFGISLLQTPSETLANIVSPVKAVTHNDHTVLNSIGSTVTSFTDVAIVQRIITIAEKYDTLFIVFGASHAVRQEKALRELLTEKTESLTQATPKSSP